MMNTQDVSNIEPLLDEDVHFSSVGEIPSKQDFLDYMSSQLLECKQSGTRRPYAEMANVSAWGHNECVAMALGEKENLTGTVFIALRQGEIRRIDLCGSPHLSETLRSDEYPS